MSAKYWKLVITPISTAASASAAMRQVVVEGDNWLSALRAARKALGEDGAVPTGASCVMSATGEVTILDAAQRLRYVLSRSETAPAETKPTAAAPQSSPNRPPSVRPPPPAAAGAVPAPGPAPALGTHRRAATVAYSPEESAAIRAQVAAAAPDAARTPMAAPDAANPTNEQESGAKFAPARPLSRPPVSAPSDSQRPDPRRPIPSKRSSTVAYAPTERPPAVAPLPLSPDQLEQRRVGGPQAPELAAATPSLPPVPNLPAPALTLPAAPTAAPALTAPPAPAAPSPLPPAAIAPPPAIAAPAPPPAPEPPARPARPGRKQTMAYLPEQAAAARAEMGATSAAVHTVTSIASSAQDHLVQSEVPSMMVTLGHRDEEPSAESPLSYRERSYFWQPPADRDEVERALRAELATLRKGLTDRPRGQYVNLAVFDHAFQDKPAKPPVATLQWKDWRGEPAFAWLGEPAAAQWTAPQPQQPVVSSFFPDAPLPASAPPPPPPPAPAPLAPPVPAPVDRSDHATQPTRRHAPTPVPDNQQGKRDATGEQDLRLAVAFEATQDLYFLATPADGLDFAVKLLAELIPAEAVSGCIYDINTDEFRFVAVSGTGSAERRAAAVRGSSGLFAAAARSGLDTLVVPDIANEPRYDPDADGRTGLLASNMAYFVLHRGGQLFGMLQIINREGPKGFREGDIAVGSYVANQVTAFLREKRGLGGR